MNQDENELKETADIIDGYFHAIEEGLHAKAGDVLGNLLQKRAWVLREIAKRHATMAAENAEQKRQIDTLRYYAPKAMGSTPEQAVRFFSEVQWPGEKVDNIVTDDSDDPNVWGVRCRVDGTGMKIGGTVLPGGYLVTWWC